MVSESIEFVSNYFDQTFSPVLDKPDVRIKSLKQFVNSIHKIRNERKEGAVVVDVQTMDSFRHIENAILNVMRRIESGALNITNKDGVEISKIYIASFGRDSAGKETKSGWSGPVSKFIEIINEAVQNASTEEQRGVEGSNTHYLRNIPEKLVKNKSTVEYIILGIVIESNDSFFDTAGISIVGKPEQREEEIITKAVLRMFGYD